MKIKLLLLSWLHIEAADYTNKTVGYGEGAVLTLKGARIEMAEKEIVHKDKEINLRLTHLTAGKCFLCSCLCG